MGWLTEATDWMGRQAQMIWSSVEAFANDLVVHVIATNLSLWLLILENIPVPEFARQYTIGGFLGNIGPDLLWFMSMLRIGEGFGLLGLGYAARLVRKALTLGQW